METKGVSSISSQLPIKEKKYIQTVEEMKYLIQYLKEYMRSCPKDDIIFSLTEKVDYYSLSRTFKLKSITPQNNNENLKKFVDNLLNDMASLESFIVIPTIHSFEIEAKSNKGNKFKAPKVYDINGDETMLGVSAIQNFLFFYDNLTDLCTFISKNANANVMILCVGINTDFFEVKKWLKNKGLLNNRNFFFYFSEISVKAMNSSTNIKLHNLPRVAVIGNENIIEDKYIKNVNTFDIQRDLINILGQRVFNNEEQVKADRFINLENDGKRKVVKSMNIYLRNNGFNEVNFYVKSKISIDKKGIKKIKCYPVFYGEANNSAKNLIDNLITDLNGQKLFYEIQCKVKYIQGK